MEGSTHRWYAAGGMGTRGGATRWADKRHIDGGGRGFEVENKRNRRVNIYVIKSDLPMDYVGDVTNREHPLVNIFN